MTKFITYKIALSKIPFVGIQTLRLILPHFNNDLALIFKAKEADFQQIKELASHRIKAFFNHKNNALELARKEEELIANKDIKVAIFTDKTYPKDLVHCYDAPILVYSKGNFDFNNQKLITIVGTRNCSEYGKEQCKKIIKKLAPYNPVIVSGMAYGIDFLAHQYAYQNNLTTIAVMGHGLGNFYPTAHKAFAQKILSNGGLVSEFGYDTPIAKENFPRRNRILAGISQATLVIETPKKGGTIITAELANDYNREVFAIPGRISDKNSEGSNNLIKSNKATLITDAEDIVNFLNWESKKEKQITLFDTGNLNSNEKKLVNLLEKHGDLSLDQMVLELEKEASYLNSMLLQLELKNIIVSSHGNRYSLA